MKLLRACLAVVLVAWSHAAAAQSQYAVSFEIYFPPEPVSEVVRHALELPYGKALLASFVQAVTKTADPACLQSRKLEPDRLAIRSRDVFQRHGTAMLEMFVGLVDKKAAAKALAAAGGSDVELSLLAEHADVKALRDIVQPARLAMVANLLFENFDRYNTLTRTKFPAVWPLAGGDEALLAQDPTDRAIKAGRQFIEENDSAKLRRFLTLSEMSQQAIRESIDRKKAMASGPVQWLKGIDKSLADLCVTKRSG
jgi:hypothetical protein